MTEAPATASGEDEPLDPRFIAKMRKLIAKEDVTLWDQGDALVAYNPKPSQWGPLAQLLCRKVATLRERMEVSEAFDPAVRDRRYSWSIYKVLLRVDPTERIPLLLSRDAWTMDEIKEAVVEKLADRARAQGKASEPLSLPERDHSRRGMRVGGVSVVGEQVGPNQFKVSIKGPVLSVEPHDLPGEYVLVCTIVPD